LQMALSETVNESFNMLTVDGDTSTNDMVAIIANGLAKNTEVVELCPDYYVFQGALLHVLVGLTRMIATDGEGATKLLLIEVINSDTALNARLIAKSVANSNLVKTAMYGNDANWGRILAAAGYSGADFDPDKVSIFFASEIGREEVACKGANTPFNEEKAKAVLQASEVRIIIDLNCGNMKATAYTCDLSEKYIEINAAYRT
ncbi:MAG: bifunctional ornithine acetyltransferase/N-acetylglutamate synthase, partial [bacterium]|nr:bifunctional ornithine acetyltransferase/N-acetylglutamate synthase [bacterium]